MTRFEKIKQMTAEEFSKILCDLMDYLDPDVTDFPCDVCPWSHLCHSCNNGAEAWLNEEVKGDE